MHVVDMQCLGHHTGTATVVACDQVAFDTSRVQRGDSLRRTVLKAIAESEQAKHTRLRSRLDQPGQRASFGFPGLRLTGESARLQAVIVQQAPIAQGQRTAVEITSDAAPSQRLALLHIRHVQPVLFAAIEHRPRQRMFTAALQRAGLLLQRGLVAIVRMQMHDPRLT